MGSAGQLSDGVGAQLAAFGPYFAVELHAAGEAPGSPWRSLAELLTPEVMAGRVDAVRRSLAGGRSVDEVELRVAASVTHLGLLARLLSPRVGAAALGVLLPSDLADDRWQPTLNSAFPLSLAAPPALPASTSGGMLGAANHAVPAAMQDWPPFGTSGTGRWRELPEHARMAWAQALLAGVATPLRDAIDAVVDVSPRVTAGNLASALDGITRAAGAHGRVDPDVYACVTGLLRTHTLADTWTGAVATDRFRRRSCCLIYRVTGPATPATTCGDCVLRLPA